MTIKKLLKSVAVVITTMTLTLTSATNFIYEGSLEAYADSVSNLDAVKNYVLKNGTADAKACPHIKQKFTTYDLKNEVSYDLFLNTGNKLILDGTVYNKPNDLTLTYMLWFEGEDPMLYIQSSRPYFASIPFDSVARSNYTADTDLEKLDSEGNYYIYGSIYDVYEKFDYETYTKWQDSFYNESNAGFKLLISALPLFLAANGGFTMNDIGFNSYASSVLPEETTTMEETTTTTAETTTAQETTPSVEETTPSTSETTVQPTSASSESEDGKKDQAADTSDALPIAAAVALITAAGLVIAGKKVFE